MKICVLVKEVPDAAVEKRMDPGTKRLDRSGEKNLNPFDTHAIEAAMQVKEGGAVTFATAPGFDGALEAMVQRTAALGGNTLYLARRSPDWAYVRGSAHWCRYLSEPPFERAIVRTVVRAKG